ncbi:TonB-dependent receptor [Olivibacter sp. SDN3]|uniref:SusC/RagA family TonB-linked outer membrane protein n=1 Tax=Olivibacter sp. SDN3 TaxID=2764720 RepID=UPI001650E6D7|nr:TonB-dependent receptor [Olivibacter sp. SDN3]QNL49450.1 TonB-dependent receptor [Olivibacter sp. SDN3]
MLILLKQAKKIGLILLLLLSITARAQQPIKGKVISSEDQLPIPGASVKIKGTNTGSSTNEEGNFTINANVGDILLITYVGMDVREVSVTSTEPLLIELNPGIGDLDEVVVVGYGVQQKKLVTGASVQVKGEDILKQNTTNALQALQGQTPGVQITSTSGQPGESMRVIIRGVGTVNNASPLYVVDGVLTNDITYLNPNDIASIDVLKDAASAAIYGSQAANGVILVTTKQGKKGQSAQISFDGFTGIQQVADKIGMLDATSFGIIMNEAAVNSGKQPYFSNQEIAQLGEGTNWMNQLFVDNAIHQNYSLSAQGGGEHSTYSTSLSYTGQEGIVGGKDLSNYERINYRINSEHNLYNDIIRFGEHLTFTYLKSNGIGVGNQYNNSLRGAFNTSSFVPMYDENGNFFDNSNSSWNNGEANPYAQMFYDNQNTRNSQRLFGDIYMVIEPFKGLRFRTSLGLDYNVNESRSFEPIYKLSAYAFNDFSRINQNMGKGKTLLWDNLLSYNFDVRDDHQFEAMVGTSAFQYEGSSMWGTNINAVFNDLEHAWLSNATNRNDATQITIGGSPDDPDKRMSYFGRLNYNYKGTYLLNATFRADGSSKFARSNRWGYFPSISAGWVITNENFMAGANTWLDFFKLRASWGQVGNQNIAAFQFMAPVSFLNTNYIFGNTEGVLTPGAFPSRLSNTALRWETSEQANIGFDARLLNNRMDINFDWYTKITKDWLVEAPILATAGADAPFINGGDVRNSGIELAIAYHDHIGEFNYSIGVNGTYNRNKVGQIPTADGIIHGNPNVLYDNSLEFYRAENGFPIGYFWGLRTDGIFQSEEEVNNYRNGGGTLIQPSAQPGDVRYVDLNGDGIINDADKTIIGNPNPDYTFGFNISGNYKGFDFAVQASGVAGNQLVQSYRNHANPYANYTTSILDRWHGPGSSNTLPRLTEDARNWTNFSDLYIHNGDFLRINTITLGYDFGSILNRNYLRKVRLYASILNAFTFTRYNGMDPEIGYAEGFASGVDLGYYPRPRTLMIGTNITF